MNIIDGSNSKPVASSKLKDFFQDNGFKKEDYLYLGYPILKTELGNLSVDAVYLSKKNGLVIFVLIEGSNYAGYEDQQDAYANAMDAKLRSYKELLKRRNLLVTINVITYGPNIKIEKFDEEYPLCNDNNINLVLSQLPKWENEDLYNKLVPIIQSVSGLRKKNKSRIIENNKSKGFILQDLEESIASLDYDQNKAIISNVNGVQRIRGLAGSGKTVIIALKAAFLHIKNPNWKIAITFNTRSLKGQFRQLIRSACIKMAQQEPNWENIRIINAWGASGGDAKTGIYYEFCMENNIKYYDFQQANNKFKTKNIFDEVCKDAIKEKKSNEIKSFYDVILVDEAQDFSSGFLRLCYLLLNDNKRLVYAYDELQNLSNKSLPSPEEIFGKKSDGSPYVKFSKDDKNLKNVDFMLKKCYRNSRPILVTAHALGFGIYKENSKLVQMFEDKKLWKDIGYESTPTVIKYGENVELKRNIDSSPEWLENHSSLDELIQFKSFLTREEQDEYVSQQIKKNLEEDELECSDIIVINVNAKTTRRLIAPIREKLFKLNISSHIAGVDTDPDIFFDEKRNSVTCSGIHRAKGNEAGMVYVVNAQDGYDMNLEEALYRNSLFTAITRSKAWVRVFGVGSNMDKLVDEYKKVKDNEFTLNFTYPTEKELSVMRIVNRDKSDSEKKVIAKGKSSVKSFLEKVVLGEVNIEDLGEENLTKLKELLNDEK